MPPRKDEEAESRKRNTFSLGVTPPQVSSVEVTAAHSMATGVTLSKASASASKHEASAGARLRRFSQQSSSSGNSLPAPLADHPMTIANADLKLHNYCHWWVIDPRKVAFVAHWDLAMTLGLLYVALVTPVEVAFVKSPALDAKWSNPIFLINRLLDVMFIADMLLQFRLGYKQE